ncbi:MAG: permease prefix domain 1-containing protein [Phycisphaerales bacterium JB054]
MSTTKSSTSTPTPPADLRAPEETHDQIGAWLDRLVRLTRLPAAEAAELRDELDAHLRERVRDLMLSGHDEPDAIHRSISELGDLAQLAQRYREASRTPRRRLFMNLAVIAVAGSALGLSTLALQHGQPETPAAALAEGEFHLVPRAVTTPEGTGISLEIVPRPTGDGGSVPVLANIPVVGRLFGGDAPVAAAPQPSADDQQLRDVFLTLAEPYDARVYTYWNDLDLVDLAVDTRVGFMPFEGQSVEKALAMLSDAYGLSGDESLDHRVENGLMEIATRRFFDQREVTLVSYDAAELLCAVAPLEQSAESEMLMELITSLVEPPVWERHGGLSTINVAGNRLFVNAPTRIHKRVVWLLEELAADGSDVATRDLDDADVMVVYPLVHPDTEFAVRKLGHALREFGAEVHPDPKHEAVIVVGDRAAQSAAEAMVRALEEEHPAAAAPVESSPGR